MQREHARHGMHVWAIAKQDNQPYECIIWELGQGSNSYRCSLNFAHPKDVPLGIQIAWKRYDQIEPFGELTAATLEDLRRATAEPDPLTPKQELAQCAQSLTFDLVQGAKGPDEYRDSPYFIICDFPLNLCAIFAQNKQGYTEAIAWMKSQREGKE